MEQHVVALVPLDTYDQPVVDEAVRAGLALLGGVEKFVSPGSGSCSNTNLLGKALPQKAVTTHPAVFAAVGSCCGRRAATALLTATARAVDHHARRAAEGCGIAQAADERAFLGRL